MSTIISRSALVLALATAMSLVSAQPLRSDANVVHGIPSGGSFSPPGTLYDNGQSNAITSLASQDSSGTFTARTADDFVIDSTGCPSNQFDISLIRAQMVQFDTATQPFAVNLFADNGSGTAPTPAGAITPIATVAESAQTNFGTFGAGTSIFEASFVPTNLVLDGGTRYWISGFGASAATNASTYNNFFASSDGAAATTANGVVIAPSGVPNWTPVEAVIGGSPTAYSFAIDGTCRAPSAPDVPVPFSPISWMFLLGAVGVLGGFYAWRRSL